MAVQNALIVVQTLEDKMNKKLLIFGIAILLVCVGLSGCTDTNTRDDRFFGVWKDAKNPSLNSITFLSDGTGSSSGISMVWEIKDGKLVITNQVSGGEVKGIYDYNFSNNNQKLILTDVNSLSNYTLIKQ